MSNDAKNFRSDFREVISIPPEIRDDVLGFIDAGLAEVWARPALTRRERSMITLGILTALRADEELRGHIVIALENSGVSRAEVCEVLLHAAMYAGFPAALHGFGVADALFERLDARDRRKAAAAEGPEQDQDRAGSPARKDDSA